MGLVVKASARGAEDGEFDSCLRLGDFSKCSHTSDFKIGTPVCTLSCAWHYRVSAGTSHSNVYLVMCLQCVPCHVPGVIGSALGLVTPVCTLSCAWRYRVSAGTSHSNVYLVMCLQCVPCHVPGVIGSVLGLVTPMCTWSCASSVYLVMCLAL